MANIEQFIRDNWAILGLVAIALMFLGSRPDILESIWNSIKPKPKPVPDPITPVKPVEVQLEQMRQLLFEIGGLIKERIPKTTSGSVRDEVIPPPAPKTDVQGFVNIPARMRPYEGPAIPQSILKTKDPAEIEVVRHYISLQEQIQTEEGRKALQELWKHLEPGAPEGKVKVVQ